MCFLLIALPITVLSIPIDLTLSKHNDRKESYSTLYTLITKLSSNVETERNEFLNLANQFSEKRPNLNFSKVLNWGTWTEEEYAGHAIHLPTHPGYKRYLEVLNATGLNRLK